MTNFFLAIFTNALGLYLADLLIPGFAFIGASSAGTGKAGTVLVAALMLGIINFFIKPVLKILSAPLIILTLGLWMIFINMFLLWLLQLIITDLTITTFWAYFWATLLLTALNIFIGHYLKDKGR